MHLLSIRIRMEAFVSRIKIAISAKIQYSIDETGEQNGHKGRDKWFFSRYRLINYLNAKKKINNCEMNFTGII